MLLEDTDKSWLAERDSVADALDHVSNYVLVPHVNQRPILDSEARFKVVSAGRRFGKTLVSARILVKKAIEKPGMLGWWVAPEYKNVKRGYAAVVAQIPPMLLSKPAPPPTSQHLELNFKNGSRIEFYAGSNPDALAGAGVDFAVIDEAALVPHGEHVWDQLIRPTLMDRKGGALFISTPRGKNWFWRLYKKGMSKARGDKDWEAWHYTSLDNPTIPDIEQEVRDSRDTMPDMLFQQEIMAEFMSSAASIFNLEHPTAIVPQLSPPVGSIVMGIDLAKKQDFTVITASRVSDRMPVYHRRFNAIKWTEQRTIIKDSIQELLDAGADDVRVGVDATGVGDAIADDLEAEGLDVDRIMFTNQWKERTVGLLAKDLQNGEAHVLESASEEFRHYEYSLTPAGRYKFESSVGHDDEVSAKLIEHYLMSKLHTADVRVIHHIEAKVTDSGETAAAVTGPDDPRDIMDRPGAWGVSGSPGTTAGRTYS